MVFTYSGNPGQSDKDSVRFLVGDTDPDLPFLQDEEIEWVIQTWKDKDHVYFYAAKAAGAISAKMAREVSITSDGQSFSLSELQQRFKQLETDLMDQYSELLASGVTVSAGGFLAGERRDPNTKPFSFGTQMHDHPRAGGQDYGDYGDYGYSGDWEWGERVP